MRKILYAFLLAGLAFATNPSFAQSDAPTVKKEAVKKTVKKPIKKKNAKKAAVKPSEPQETVANDDDDDVGEMKIEGSTVTNFSCELGNKVTTYINESDTKHIALRWKDKLHRLHRVGTTTGANRFENRKFGLVWINIPSKAMLLDSKKGQQLANECRNPDQEKVFAAKG